MQALPQDGDHIAVFAGVEQLAPYLVGMADTVSIAAINAPDHTVLSGGREAIQGIAQQLRRDGVGTQRLTVSHAFHSPLMDPILARFERVAGEITPSPPRIGIVSDVTGELADSADYGGAAYWRRHLREPVQFAAGMRALLELGAEWFVEVGPRPTLLGLGRKCAPEGRGLWLPSVRNASDTWPQLLKSLGTLYVHGAAINWAEVERGAPHRRVPLPTYPFQHSAHWLSREQGAKTAQPVPEISGPPGAGTPGGPLLGRRLRSALKETQFENQLRGVALPYLREHRIHGTTIFPAAGYVEMALAAATAIGKQEPWAIERCAITEPLFLKEEVPQVVQLIVDPEADARASFRILSRVDGSEDAQDTWRLHATGILRREPPGPVPPPSTLAEARERCTEELAVGRYYDELRTYGLEYGASFRSITRLWRHPGAAVGRIQLPEQLVPEAGAYRLHPVVLDGCLQTFAAALRDVLPVHDAMVAYLPTGIDTLRLTGEIGPVVWCYAELRPVVAGQAGGLGGDLYLFNEQGRPVAELRGVCFQPAPLLTPQSSMPPPTEWLYGVAWSPQRRPAASLAATGERPSWWIFADAHGIGAALAASLTASGAAVTLIYPGGERAHAPGRCTIDPSCPDDFRRGVDDLVRQGRPPCTGVVYLWGMDLPALAVAEQPADPVALGCGGLLALVQALAGATWQHPPRLWIVTRGGQQMPDYPGPLALAQAPLWGLGRVIALEHPELQCSMIDLDPDAPPAAAGLLFDEIRSGDRETQLAFRQNERIVARFMPLQAPVATGGSDTRRLVPPHGPFRLESRPRGLLANLTLVPTRRYPPAPGEVEIRVHATGLNFRDVIGALGLYPGDPGPLGSECAGHVVAVGEGVISPRVGEAVMAIAPGCFGQYATTKAALVVAKPPQLRFESAAALPIAFLTAYYALHHLARVAPGDRVLIHAASGGVGLAAVQVARLLGAEIWASAGSEQKRAFLRELGVQHVLDSRSLGFADVLLERTGGAGVDVILNSLTGEFIDRNMAVLKPDGRYLEIGKIGVWEAEQVARVKPGVAYHLIDLADVCDRETALAGTLLREILGLITTGRLAPLRHTIFPLEETVDAFRYMERARHIGKIVVAQPQDGPGAGSSALPRLREDGTYVITGGFGGLGQQIARWMIDQGARHLVLVGRNADSEPAAEVTRELRRSGARVMAAPIDVADERQVAQLLGEVRRGLPPLRGIVHAAGILDDGMLAQQTPRRFAGVLAPKVAGAWHLHTLTQGEELDFFVLFSSIAAVLGSPGQGSYAAANAFLDALGHHRRALGLPALSINWGPWAAVGMAATAKQGSRLWAAAGVSPIPPSQGATILGQLLQRPSPQAVVLPINWSQFQRRFPALARQPFLGAALPSAADEGHPGHPATAHADFLRELRAATPVERKGVALAHLRHLLLDVLEFDRGVALDPHQPLKDLGLDSLMAVELKIAVETELGRDLPITLLFDYPTLDALAGYLVDEFAASASPAGG